jgi:hypothetical protein
MRSAFLLTLLWVAAQAQASVTLYTDKVAFTSSTAATLATQPFTDTGFGNFTGPSSSIASGTVTFTNVTGGLYMGDASARLSGAEITISDTESVDVAFAGPVYSMGFDFVEPEFDPLVNASFVDSTFTVTLFSGAALVGGFSFNAANDTAAFVGVWSTAAFTRAEIRETTGGIENEFYGQFYTGALAPAATSVPEPMTLSLVGAALAACGATRRRRSAR